MTLLSTQSFVADASPAKKAGHSPSAAGNDVGVQRDEVSAVHLPGDSQNVAAVSFVVEDNNTKQKHDADSDGDQDDVGDETPLGD